MSQAFHIQTQIPYVLIGSDFSQQEPKMAAYLSNDSKLVAAAKEGRDIYSSIAAIAFNTTYEDCLEFKADGSTYKEGKKRRKQAKVIVLGILYGRGVTALAAQLDVDTAQAQKIQDEVLAIFSGLKAFKADSEDMAKTKGYVTTAWGRRRRLPDINLPKYSITLSNKRAQATGETQLPPAEFEYYTNKLAQTTTKYQASPIIQEGRESGVFIMSNDNYIARATRQCVNARVQGSAADMVKIAMSKIAKDKQLKDLGFRMLIQVHDEIIGECPYANRKACADRFAYVMSHCVEEYMDLPFNTDVEIQYNWGGESVDVD